MKELRNPFAMRSSESIESELIFLKLFGTGVLEILPDDCFLNKVTIFRSGPGGGKTSLLRLFRPESLNEIFNHGAKYKDLHDSLEKFSVLSDKGPDILGIYLRLSNYDAFQDLETDDKDKDKYLFSLIGSRLILKMLYGILALKNLEISDLDEIQIDRPVEGEHLLDLPLPCTGKQLYDWASKREQNICGIVNRFDYDLDPSISLFANLDHVYAMIPNNIKYKGQQIISKTLIMLDDLQHLRKNQRNKLVSKVSKSRYPVSIWFAERLESLELDEMIPDIVPDTVPSAIHGREYNPVYLEEYWERSRGRAFETFARSVSAKRAQLAELDFDFYSLHQHLEESIDNTELSPKLTDITNTIRGRLNKLSRTTNMFNQWIDDEERKTIQSPLNSALGWKSLEIKVARAQRDAQKKLFDIPLDIDEEDETFKLRSTSEFFIHDEFKVPYYYSFSKIAKVSSSNIEQFLEMSSELFEQIKSQLIKSQKRNIILAEKQEDIIKKIAKRHWDEIQKKNTNGLEVEEFLTSFKDFARSQTLQPNAPYAPGITGIGIKKSQYDKMTKAESQKECPELKTLLEVLQTCLAQNYLKAHYKAKQGPKAKEGKEKDDLTVLYLNRLLCAHFGLPVGQGGWRHKTLDDLCEWLKIKDPSKERK